MRIIMAGLLSLLTVFGLILGMSKMVNAGSLDEGRSYPTVNIQVTDPEDEVSIKDRIIPEEPEPTKQEQMREVLKTIEHPQVSRAVEPAATVVSGSSLPTIGSTDISMPFVGIGGQEHTDGTLSALVQIEPLYPRKASLEGLEGYVTLSFDVAADGSTQNIQVIDANPERVFNKAAIRALKKWKYRPATENGQVTASYRQQVTLEFKLEK